MKISRIMGIITLLLFLGSFADAGERTTHVIKVKGNKIPHITKHVKIATVKDVKSFTQTGIASYYGYESGPRTANGEKFNPKALTAAHRTLPFGTKILVTNLKTNQSVIVRVNDRGPYVKPRVLDLSQAAGAKIGINRQTGISKVSIKVI